MKQFINKHRALHNLLLLEISFTKMYEPRELIFLNKSVEKKIMKSYTHMHAHAFTNIYIHVCG